MANLSGSYRPTSRTIGRVGDVYTNTTTGDRFKCVDIHEIVTDEVTYYYVWTEMRSGGSSGGVVIPEKLTDLENDLFYYKPEKIVEVTLDNMTYDEDGNGVVELDKIDLPGDEFSLAYTLVATDPDGNSHVSDQSYGEIEIDDPGIFIYDNYSYLSISNGVDFDGDGNPVASDKCKIVFYEMKVIVDEGHIATLNFTLERIQIRMIPENVIPPSPATGITVIQQADDYLDTGKYEGAETLRELLVPVGVPSRLRSGEVFYDESYMGLYVQDEWSMRPKIVNLTSSNLLINKTLNVGDVYTDSFELRKGVTDDTPNAIYEHYHVDVKIKNVERYYHVKLARSDNQFATDYELHIRWTGTFYTTDGMLIGVDIANLGDRNAEVKFTRLL